MMHVEWSLQLCRDGRQQTFFWVMNHKVLGAGGAEDQSSLCLQRKNGLAYQLISVQRHQSWASNLQNWERTKLCWFKSSSSLKFVTEFSGNQYTCVAFFPTLFILKGWETETRSPSSSAGSLPNDHNSYGWNRLGLEAEVSAWHVNRWDKWPYPKKGWSLVLLLTRCYPASDGTNGVPFHILAALTHFLLMCLATQPKLVQMLTFLPPAWEILTPDFRLA